MTNKISYYFHMENLRKYLVFDFKNYLVFYLVCKTYIEGADMEDKRSRKQDS